MSQEMTEEVVQDIKVLMGKEWLICPICGLPLHRHDPDYAYWCPVCGARFNMLSYGNKTVE